MSKQKADLVASLMQIRYISNNFLILTQIHHESSLFARLEHFKFTVHRIIFIRTPVKIE